MKLLHRLFAFHVNMHEKIQYGNASLHRHMYRINIYWTSDSKQSLKNDSGFWMN